MSNAKTPQPNETTIDSDDETVVERADRNIPPEFPSLKAETSVKVTRKATTEAWSGSRSHLLQLEKLVEESLKQAYDSRVASMDNASSDFAAQAKAVGSKLKLIVNVQSTENGMLRIGSLSSVLAEMDNSEIKSVLFTNDRKDSTALPYVRVSITNSPTAATQPVNVTVVGRDRRWVAATTELISAELNKRVPSWAALRKVRVAALFSLLLLVGVSGIGISFFGPASPTVIGSFFAYSIGSLLVMGWLLTSLINYALRRWCPAFEVTEPDERSSPRRLGGIAFGTLSTLLAVIGLILAILAF